MITVAGLAPSLDITYVVDDLALGQIHRPSAVVRCAGGKPLNLARAAARLGADACVVAVLGGATGAALAADLTSESVAVVEVPTPYESRTCVSIASTASGELTEVYPYADPLPPEVWDAFVTALTTALTKRPGWLAISGGAPKELPAGALGDLVALAHRHGCRVAVDTHGAGLPAAVAARPELVKINRAEAAELLGRAPDHKLTVMAAEIAERTGGAVVLTDAHVGALAYEAGGAHSFAVPDVRGHYPVGSGDSFLGGLLTELDAGRTLTQAMITATAAGTANALVPGPGRFETETVRELRARVLVRRDHRSTEPTKESP